MGHCVSSSSFVFSLNIDASQTLILVHLQILSLGDLVLSHVQYHLYADSSQTFISSLKLPSEFWNHIPYNKICANGTLNFYF